MGRPTKCTPKLIKEAWKYLEEFQTTHGHAVASNQGLAVVLNVAESSIYLWAKEKGSPFSEILEAIKTRQCLGLINGGLDNTLNSSITRVLLGKHGIVEKTESDITANLNVANLTPEQLRAHVQAILDKATTKP